MQADNPYSTPDAPPTAPTGPAFWLWPPIAFFITMAVAVIGSIVLCSLATPFVAGLLLAPFSFGPLVVTAGLAIALRSRPAQIVLSLSSILYAAWFGYVYAQAVHINPDPQSPIAFLFVGIYAVPVLVVLWIAAGAAHWYARTARAN
jgi:hypothetical protein